MKASPIFRASGLATVCCLIFIAVASAGTIQASIGDIIPLQGYSTGSQTVYLFLTGPNLPVNGVALNDVSARADQGHFTEVDVDSNNHWEYKWGTNAMGGRLDAGTYTIWVVDTPNDRSHLGEADYGTISVNLGQPSISLNTPAVPGAIEFTATPSNTSVTVNNQYRGSTPLTLENLDPGTYTVTFSHFGYVKFTTPVKVESGRITEVTATLVPDVGSISLNTTPAGASILLDGTPAGKTPMTLPNVSSGNHTLSLEMNGYSTETRQVQVRTGQVVPLNIELIPVATTPSLPAGEPGIASVAVVTCGIGASLLLFSRSKFR